MKQKIRIAVIDGHLPDESNCRGEWAVRMNGIMEMPVMAIMIDIQASGKSTFA